MWIRLLGPVELEGTERSVVVGSPRLRAVLTALALDAHHLVSTDELIDAVWEAEPPTTARAQIQICVSELRRMLRTAGLSTTIRTQPSGYLLDLADGEASDAAAFDGLVSEAHSHVTAGDATAAVAALTNADQLWRGPVLTGISTAFARQTARRLEKARLSAAEERIELQIALGSQERVIGELYSLVARNPLREGLHRLLMLALYHSGRQSEALEAYQNIRDLLIDELGVEPGPDLQEAHRSVLEGGARIERAGMANALAQREVLRQLPASITDFTGRDAHLTSLRRRLGTGEPHDPYGVRIAAISGPGGVGKSVLAIRAAHELSEHFPDGQLYADLQGHPGEDPATLALDRFLRALGLAGSAIPDAPEERAQLYRTRLADQRVLVVLDDVRDESQARLLLPGRAGAGVIITSRTPLTSLDGVLHLEVDVLDVDESIDMLAGITGKERVRADPEGVQQLVRLCSGLPLALRICAARLTARPDLTIGRLVRRLDAESRRLDELAHRQLEVRSTIGVSYEVLGPSAQQLFRRFALVNAPDAPGWVAAALCDSDVDAGDDVMDRLVDVRLVTAVGHHQLATESRYRFHDLVRLYAMEALQTDEPEHERQAALSRLMGGWLAFAEDAHRHVYGVDYPSVHGSAARWRPSARGVPWQFPPFDRIERRALVAAVRQAADAGLDELCWDLALTLVTLYETKGYFDDWEETTRVASECVIRAENRLGLAAMRYSQGTLLVTRTHYEQALEPLLAAVEDFRALGNRIGVGLALRNLTSVYRERGEINEAIRCGRDALALFRAVTHPVAEADVLARLARLHDQLGDSGEARDLVDGAVEIIRQVGYRRGIAQALHVSATIDTRIGEFERARAASREALEIVREIDDQVGLPWVLLGLGDIEHQAGDEPAALEHLRLAYALADRLGITEVRDLARARLDR